MRLLGAAPTGLPGALSLSSLTMPPLKYGADEKTGPSAAPVCASDVQYLTNLENKAGVCIFALRRSSRLRRTRGWHHAGADPTS